MSPRVVDVQIWYGNKRWSEIQIQSIEIFFFFNPNFNHIPAFFISPPPTKCSDFSFPHYFFFSFFCLKLGLKSAYFSMGQCRKWLRLFFTYPKEFSFPGEIISYLTWNVTVCLIYILRLHRKANTFYQPWNFTDQNTP